METAFTNLLEPGETVLVPSNGYFGDRMGQVAARAGAEVVTVDAPWGEPLDPADVEAAFEEHQPAVFGFVHGETSTGVRQPDVPGLTEIAHDHDAYVVADTVPGLGGTEFHTDDWDVDVVYTGSQKCLSAPPGVSPITFNDRAVEKVRARETPVRSWYLDLLDVWEYWGEERNYHHTGPISTTYALREAPRTGETVAAAESYAVFVAIAEDGTPVRVYKKPTLEANQLIEDFMLLANREVARYFNELCKERGLKNPIFVYRVHDVPDPDKIEELGIFLRAIGYDFETEEGAVTAKQLNKLFSEIEGTPEEDMVKIATIRSMAKAVYSTKNIGHFGLSFTYYTHFTSPIRRYPDMMVHRIFKSHIYEHRNISKQELRAYEKLAIQSSQREMEAVEAERESIKYKQVEYMAEHVGETFDAYVSGVTEFGLFVEEAETKAEGLIHISNVGNDYFTLDKENYRLVGERTDTEYSLGDKVRVKLKNADLDNRQLDFVLTE
jgi:acyl-CoA hydrolase